MADNNAINNYTFYDNATSITDTNNAFFNVTSNSSEMNIKFICDGTFQAKLYAGIIDKNTMFPYPCFKLPTFDLITDVISDDTFLYNVDLTGIDYLKIELISLVGSISIIGKAVG